MDFPGSGMQRSRPRSNRKPLQPRNSPAERPSRGDQKTKTATGRLVPIVLLADEASDKENRLPGSVMAAMADAVDIPPMDTSLAEELGAVRRRRERMRSEREKTEAMLLDRGRLLDRAMMEVERRWEEHRRVELELRRLTRLQAMAGSPCSELRPYQSLREREEERRKKEAQSQVTSNKEAEVVAKENVDQESSGGKKGAQNVEQKSGPSSK